MLTRLDGADVPKKKRAIKPALGAAGTRVYGAAKPHHRYGAEKVCRIAAWNEAHKRKSPDLTPEQRNTARQALQDKGLVVVDNFMCWINSDLDDNVG